MSRKYALKKESEKVVSKKKVKEIKGFSVKPRNKVKPEDMIDVDEMIVVDNGLIDKLIDKKVKREFEKVLNMYSYLLEEDDSDEGSYNIILDEIDRFKKLLLNKYKEYLKDKKVKEILKKLEIIEKEIDYRKNLINSFEKTNSKGKGR